MNETRGPMINCLQCGYPIDSAMGVPGVDRGPEPGDISMCLDCGHIAAYGDDSWTLRELTDAEMIEIAGMPELVAATNARKAVMEKRE